MFRWFQKFRPRSAPQPENGGPAATPAPAWQPSPGFLARSKADAAATLAAFTRGDYPAQRARALKTIEARLTALLAPHGFARKGREWVRALPHGQAKVIMRPLRCGDEADLRVLFLPDRWHAAKHRAPDFHGTELINFVRLEEHSAGFRDKLLYCHVNESPELVDPAFDVLMTRALPWLLAHKPRHWPDLKTYRQIA